MKATEDEIRFVLDYLGHELDPSILIGGWATHERVGGDISKDIDLIVSDESRSRVENALDRVDTSSHLPGRKLSAELNGVHVDIYEPYQSRLGLQLRLRVEELARHVDELRVGPWHLLTIEAHLITKFAALLDRPESEKGEKDAREIDRLLAEDPDPRRAIAILFDATEAETSTLPSLVEQAFGHIAEKAGVNRGRRKELDRIRLHWMEAADDELRRRQGRFGPVSGNR